MKRLEWILNRWVKTGKILFFLLFVGCSPLEIIDPFLENDGVVINRIEGIGTYNGYSSQGMAIFDRYAFLTYDTGYIQVIDLDMMDVINAYAMSGKAHSSVNHAGIANFSSQFFVSHDEFPLLYVSSYRENKCYVLRVTKSNSTLVQEIEMANAWHFFVDSDNNLIVRLNDNHYYVFDIPSLDNRGITLDLSDAKSSFVFDIPGMHYAGAVCKEGRMYVLCYYIDNYHLLSGKYDRLVVYNYVSDEVERVITFKDHRIRKNEFEGISFNKDGRIVISFAADQLAVIDLEMID